MSREKQIEEMAREICSEYDCVIPCQSCAYYGYANCRDVKSAEKLYNAGYRKQSEGEWVQSRSKFGLGQSNCSVCNGYVDGYTSYRYCPHCGTKIQGIRSK